MDVPQAVVDQINQEVSEVDVGGFTKTEDEAQLFRILRLRGRAEDELERVKRESSAWIKRLQNRLDSIDYVLKPVASELAKRILAGKKVKSVRTPFGSAGYRTVPGGLEVEDTTRLLEAWHNNQLPMELIKVEQKFVPVMAEINDLFKKTGEVPPGCGVREDQEKFYLG